MWGSLDSPLPLWGEESLAPPILRVAPWTPAVAASLFCGLGLGLGLSAPSPWGIQNGSLCRGHRRHWPGYGGGIMGP